MKRMGKKILSVLIAAMLMVSVIPFSASATPITSADELQDALDAGGVITLTQNITESKAYTVPIGGSVTLEMGDYSITGSITNNSTNFTINGGEIVIDPELPVANYTGAAITNTATGDITIDGLKINTSSDKYLIVNKGNMSIDDASIVSTSVKTALVINTGTASDIPYLEIDGGSFTGGLYCVKNEDYGLLTINDGTFTNTYVEDEGPPIDGGTPVMNFSYATINGGTFISNATAITTSIWVGHLTECPGETEIYGGYFKAEGSIIGAPVGDATTAMGTTVIYGGSYSKDIAPIIEAKPDNVSLAQDHVIVGVNDTNYPYIVTEASIVEPDVEVDDTNADIESGQEAEAKNIAKGIELDTDILDEAIEDIIKESGETLFDAATNSYIDTFGDTDLEDINFFLKPVLDISIVEYNHGDDTYVFDITPKLLIIASKKTVIGDVNDGNSVTVAYGEIDIEEDIEIIIPLPTTSSLAIAASNVFVRHNHNGKDYYYPAIVESDGGGGGGGGKQLRFTNTNGFSEFEVVPRNTDTATVKFTFEDTTTNTETYTLSDVGTVFDTDTKVGQTFVGWSFDGGIEGTYTELTATLLAEMAGVGSAINATPVFRTNGGGGGSTGHTVTYSVDQKGTITSGATTEVVADGETPKNPPVVKGKDRYVFSHWALGGKRVDPRTVTIDKDITFDAVFGLGFISGYADKTFHPEFDITRAEFLKMAIFANPNNYNPLGDYKNDYSDITGTEWYAPIVGYATEKGYVSGHGGKFRPEDKITREDAAKVVCEVFEIDVDKDAKTDKFKDIDSAQKWAIPYITALTEKGIIGGYKDGTFKPANKILRSEASKMISVPADFNPDAERRAEIAKDNKSPFSDVANKYWAFSYILFGAGVINE